MGKNSPHKAERRRRRKKKEVRKEARRAERIPFPTSILVPTTQRATPVGPEPNARLMGEE